MDDLIQEITEDIEYSALIGDKPRVLLMEKSRKVIQRLTKYRSLCEQYIGTARLETQKNTGFALDTLNNLVDELDKLEKEEVK